MSDVSLKAKVQFTPRDNFGRYIEVRVTPAAIKGTKAANGILFDATQQRVHVDSGDLKSSGTQEIEVTERTVVGRVIYTAAHARFNEFGTGIRGAASPGASADVTYSSTWPGMAAIPFMRPALDDVRDPMKNAFASEMSAGLKV